jgi:hypothetical protein
MACMYIQSSGFLAGITDGGPPDLGLAIILSDRELEKIRLRGVLLCYFDLQQGCQARLSKLTVTSFEGCQKL